MKAPKFLAAIFLFLFMTCAMAEPRLEANKNREKLAAIQGKPAPVLELTQWTNTKELKMADLKGKVVVLDFWATWCGPCIASIPKMNQLSKKYAEKDVVILGVCAKDGVEKMGEIVKTKNIQYPVAADTEGKTVAAYMPDSFPDYYIIDRKGNLRWADFANADVEKAIELLAAEK